MVNYTRNIDRHKLNVTWNNMNYRCYSDEYHDRSPQYIGCSICDEWLDDKEAFYEWVLENHYTVGSEQIDLDKDILVKGNKIYSPDTCIFTPHSINTYFEHITREPILQQSGKYRMDIYIEGKSINIGYYDTAEEAKRAYIKHKEATILAKADIYKDRIPRALYNAMVNCKIELSDWDRK